MLDDLKDDLIKLLREPSSNQEAIERISKKIKTIELNNIKKFLSNKKDLLSDLKFITANFEEMGLNDNDNFDYPFIESFDEIVAELSEKMDYEDIKIIHTKMIKRLEEAVNRAEEEQDLKEILKLDIVKDASLEHFNGFGRGTLKDGRPFCFGRVNGPLEMDIYSDQEALENGFEAVEFIKVRE